LLARFHVLSRDPVSVQVIGDEPQPARERAVVAAPLLTAGFAAAAVTLGAGRYLPSNTYFRCCRPMPVRAVQRLYEDR
jgi:hypothetical protein